MKTRTAIFPGSFDPFTLGHLDILKSAVKLFDRIIIAVGHNHLKKGFLSPEARVSLIEESVRTLKEENPDVQIDVMTYSGMTIDFCKKMQSCILVRGLRTTADFESETIIAQANKHLYPEIETILLPPAADHSFITSTVVRDVYYNHGDTSRLLAPGIILEKYL